MDYYRNSCNPLVARLFWPEDKPKFPANRRLDPYPDRDCRHPHYFETVGDHVDLQFVRDKRGGQTGCPFIHNKRNMISSLEEDPYEEV